MTAFAVRARQDADRLLALCTEARPEATDLELWDEIRDEAAMRAVREVLNPGKAGMAEARRWARVAQLAEDHIERDDEHAIAEAMA